MELNTHRRDRIIRIAACLCTIGILFLIYALQGMAPFGTASLAREDANIQYLQFYSYLKDVLSGKQDLLYSLSIGLGLSGVPLLNYYLQSPLNLLVVFFRKSQLHIFFDLAVALKLGLCAWTFAYYLQHRFARDLRDAAVLSLALCYALMQYTIAQSSNLMWLDGIVMLPLILLGVWQVVRKGQIGLLAGSFAVNLLLNWYIAAVNALFSLMILLLERLFREEQTEETPSLGGAILRWGRAGIRALLLAAFSFLPMVIYLIRGKGASLDTAMEWGTLMGNPLETLRSFRLWSICQPGSVTWYCGSIALLGLFLFLFSPNISLRKKCAGSAAVLLLNLCYYWQPLFRLFSLLKEPMGHWCRYSYLGSTLLLIITAHALASLRPRREGQRIAPAVMAAAGASALMLVLLNRSGLAVDERRSLLTAGALVVTAALLLLCRSRPFRRLAPWLLTAVIAAELGCNAWGLAGFYATRDVAEYETYVKEQSAQIDALRIRDPEVYRIAQTSVRLYEENGRTADFDESMAFGYASNTAYHSVPDNRQLRMLDQLGYPVEAGCMNIVNTTILPADSLLGVRYILSSVPLPGLLPVADLPEADGKRVYENPDAFPMAFCTAASAVDGSSEDPFRNINTMIRSLTGCEQDVFVPAEVSVTAAESEQTVSVSAYRDRPILYGYFPDRGEKEWKISTAEGTDVTLGGWLSPRTLMLSTDGEAAVLTQQGEVSSEALFYRMDGEALRTAAALARNRSGELIRTGAGRFAVTAAAEKGEVLYLSIPYSEDFTVKVNGTAAAASPAGTNNAMMRIPLDEGENTVTLVYHIPGLGTGIALTLLEAGFLCVLRRRKKS